MAGQIKGITIEFDGETTKLENALRKVKTQAGQLDSALRDVKYGLRFDPKNTELLSQKQTLLKQKIEATKTALTKLKDIQKQLDDKKIDKTSAAYMRVSREIEAAKGKLRTFNAQLAATKWSGVKSVGQGIQTVGQKLTRATRYARLFAGALAGIALYKGFERLKSLDEVSKQMEVLGYRGKKLDGIMEDVSGSVNGTRFMLQDMAKVATGALGSGVTDSYKLNDYLTRTADLAQLAGIDVQSMGSMMNKAYSKGKVDAKIMNQLNAHGIPIYKLMQKELGVTAEELQEMSRKGKLSFDDLYKATDRYEGLAQKMGTETLPGALTVLTQQFGLIGADFLSGVYEPLKTGVQGIVAAIKEMRQNGTFKQWGQDLGDAVKYFVTYFKEGEASMDGLSQRSQNLVTVLGPLIKTIGGLVQIIAQLPPGLQSVLVLMTLFGGPALQALGSAVQLFASIGTNISTMTLNAQAGVGALGGLGNAASLLANPFTLAAAAIAAWALGMQKAWTETHQATIEFNKWKESSDRQIEATKASNGQIDLYKKKLDELVGKEHKSAGDKALIKTYVDKLNGAIDGLNLKYDAEKDKLNQTSKAIEKKIEKYKQAALVAAFEDQITEAAKKEADAQIELEKLYEDRAAIQKKWNEATDHGWAAQQGYNATMGEVNAKIKDAKKAIGKYDEEMDRSARKVKELSSTTKHSLDSTASEASKAGKKTGGNYAGGIKSEKGNAKTAAKTLADSGKNALDVDTSGMGSNFGGGFIKGIMSRVREVAKAAANFVRSAINAAKAEEQEGSPSKVMRKVGQNFGAGYALGIQDETQAAVRASTHMVGSAINAATSPAGGLGLQSAGGGNVFNINMNVDGAEDPESWADRFARRLELEVRGE